MKIKQKLSMMVALWSLIDIIVIMRENTGQLLVQTHSRVNQYVAWEPIPALVMAFEYTRINPFCTFLQLSNVNHMSMNVLLQKLHPI